jgi:hypothetical protein
MRLARWLYGLALLTMPLTFATRDLFGAVGITWVDPTLILGLVVFLLLRAPIKEKAAVWLLGFAFLSAFVGALLLRASADRDRAALYVYYVEPIRLTLNIIWFWVSLRFLRLDRKFVLRWLAICVALEFSVACYLFAAFYDLVPVPDAVRLYLEIYKTRQAIWWGDLMTYRMAGTFFESPPFGLFMFCCLVIFVLALWYSQDNRETRFRIWLGIGAICSFLGTVASLADQVLIGLLALGITLLFVYKGGDGFSRKLLWSGLVAILALYVTSALAKKGNSESGISGDPMGMSVGERLFHARYGLGLFLEQPASVITGIGPGRYGDYAVRTGYFPSTVVTGVTVIDWVVEYGLVGLFLIGVWLFRIGSKAVLGYGILGAGALVALLIANMFQANWLWESWFLVLAFLYSSVPDPTLKAARDIPSGRNSYIEHREEPGIA